MRTGHLPDWSSPNDPARVLAAVGRLNPSGHKCLFYGIFGPFLTPLEAPRAILVGPNGPNEPSWMYPTQIQLRSTEIQPFGATRATYGHICLFYGIFGPFLTPLEAPGAISMGPNGPNGPSWMYPTQI